MENIKNLREEFDRLQKQNTACDESCDTQFEEEYPDFIVEITTKMLSPSRCGVYFSKKDIRAIAAECNEKIALKQRQRMLTDVLTSVFTPEEMQNLFSTIKDFIDMKISNYDELSDLFPHSKKFFLPRKDKAEQFKRRLDQLLEDNKAGL